MDKIYCFINGGNSFGLHVMALADDGHVLAGHLSSTEGWAKHDIGMTSDWKHDKYEKHFPNGYELEWVDNKDLETHEGVKKAGELNEKLAPKENEGSTAGHQSTE